MLYKDLTTTEAVCTSCFKPLTCLVETQSGASIPTHSVALGWGPGNCVYNRSPRHSEKWSWDDHTLGDIVFSEGLILKEK